jgi:hypothetical protein
MTSTSFIATKFYNNEGIDKYFKLRTFSLEDSKLMSKALNSSFPLHNLYFNDSGVIFYESDNKNENKVWGNLITGKKEYVRVDPCEKAKIGQEYFFSSKNGNYILYKNMDGTYSLLYNTVPRSEFSRFYEAAPDAALSSAIDGCVATKGLDPVCSCINAEKTNEKDGKPEISFCMNDLFGGASARKAVKLSGSNRQGYDTISNICGCTNTKCNKNHPFQKVFRDPSGTHKCPDGNLTVTICNSSFNAGGNLNTGQVNLQQSCGSESNTVNKTEGATPAEAVKEITDEEETIKRQKMIAMIAGGVLLVSVISMVMMKK